MIGLSAYYIHMEAFDPDPMWIQMITMKCKSYLEQANTDVKRFRTGHTYASFGLVGIPFGAYCGLLMQHRCFQGMSRISAPKKSYKNLLRTAFLMSFCITYQLLCDAIPFPEYLALWLIGNAFMRNFLFFFFLFGLSDRILLRIGLYDRHDPADDRDIKVKVSEMKQNSQLQSELSSKKSLQTESENAPVDTSNTLV